jgi:negative regulator of sigma E activity
MRARPELELEAQLSDALAQLPNISVPSNFTARVLDAIELDEARSARSSKMSRWHWNWRSLLPRVAATMAILLFAGMGVQHYETSLHRAEIAQSLSVVASAKTVPSMDALKNFDTILHMSQSGHADTELLADMQ